MKQASKYPITDSILRWLETILTERFGHTWLLSRVEQGLSLELESAEGSILFGTLQDCFTEARSDLPFTQWDSKHEGWQAVLDKPLPAPGVAQLPAPLIEKRGVNHFVHYDILGLVYWMLARIEEINRTDLDNHQRFPATSSHALKHGYIERPIVDEWLDILGQVIRRQWPTQALKQHQFSMKVSHDVDSPSLYAFKPWPAIVRMMARHLLKQHDLKAFTIAPYVKLATYNQLHSADPFNTFEWLMDLSETNNLKSAFYFICGQSDPVYDADYEPEHPSMRKLMRQIHSRGHEIGLHPSYNSFQRPEIIKQEADRLKKICTEENIEQLQWGGRMHYLRWKHPTTLRAWDAAGMAYDTTLGYADHPGFRCGTCYEYPSYDPIADKQLSLRIRPLIAMECSVMDDAYMGLGIGEVASTKFTQLKDICRKVNGDFTLLWHNSQFESHAERELYCHVLAS